VYENACTNSRSHWRVDSESRAARERTRVIVATQHCVDEHVDKEWSGSNCTNSSTEQRFDKWREAPKRVVISEQTSRRRAARRAAETTVACERQLAVAHHAYFQAIAIATTAIAVQHEKASERLAAEAMMTIPLKICKETRIDAMTETLGIDGLVREQALAAQRDVGSDELSDSERSVVTQHCSHSTSNSIIGSDMQKNTRDKHVCAHRELTQRTEPPLRTFGNGGYDGVYGGGGGGRC
jgi:hypothetical protein